MPTITLEDRDKLEVYYEQEGRGDPVVLIGGLTSTVEIWAALRGRLAEAYRVILPDNRGSGRTRAPDDDGARSLSGFAEDLGALLDALGLERVHLVGASMGGMIVQRFAVEHSERLLSLTVCCSHPGGKLAVQPSPQTVEKLFRSISGGTPEDARAGLEVVFNARSLDSRREAVAFFSDLRRRFPHSPEELQRRAAAIAAYDVSEQLGRIRVRTLVVTGADDVLVPPENSERIAERIPAAELAVIPDAGHLLHLEQPEATAAILMRFLAG